MKQQPQSEDDIALDYVEEEPTYTTGDALRDTFGNQNYWEEDPHIVAGLSTPPSPEYIQSFQQHNPLTTYDPRTSLNNYSLLLHHMEQMWGSMLQINDIVIHEQDDVLHGMLLASQATFDAATNHAQRMFQYIQEQTHG